MKPTKKRKDSPKGEWTSRQDRERDNILRPELFSVPRHSHLLSTTDRRKGEERSLVGKYLELADIALSNTVDEPSPQSSRRGDKDKNNAA
jgi:hypothetical protein